jgi:hypothetical protein
MIDTERNTPEEMERLGNRKGSAQEQAAVEEWMKRRNFSPRTFCYTHADTEMDVSIEQAAFFYRSEQAACQKAVVNEVQGITEIWGERGWRLSVMKHLDDLKAQLVKIDERSDTNA